MTGGKSEKWGNAFREAFEKYPDLSKGDSARKVLKDYFIKKKELSDQEADEQSKKTLDSYVFDKCFLGITVGILLGFFLGYFLGVNFGSMGATEKINLNSPTDYWLLFLPPLLCGAIAFVATKNYYNKTLNS